MYTKFKCFSCGGTFKSREVLAMCPICKGKGVKIREEAEDSEKEEWDKAILKAERFIDKSKRA